MDTDAIRDALREWAVEQVKPWPFNADVEVTARAGAAFGHMPGDAPPAPGLPSRNFDVHFSFHDRVRGRVIDDFIEKLPTAAEDNHTLDGRLTDCRVVPPVLPLPIEESATASVAFQVTVS